MDITDRVTDRVTGFVTGCVTGGVTGHVAAAVGHHTGVAEIVDLYHDRLSKSAGQRKFHLFLLSFVALSRIFLVAKVGWGASRRRRQLEVISTPFSNGYNSVTA